MTHNGSCPLIDPGALRSTAARFGTTFSPGNLDEQRAVRAAFTRLHKQLRTRVRRIESLRASQDDINDLYWLSLLIAALFDLVRTRGRNAEQEELYWELLRRFGF